MTHADTDTDIDDEPTRDELENRVEQLEQTVQQMLPSRRGALKLGGTALAAGALGSAATGSASAGTNSVGTIGSASSPVDAELEDINPGSVRAVNYNNNEITNVSSLSTDKATINELSAVLEKSTDQSISSNTDTTVDWDIQNLDTNLYSYNTSNNELEVLSDGDYSVSVFIRVDAFADQNSFVSKVLLNGSKRRTVVEFASGGSIQASGAFALKELSANDKIKFDVRAKNSAATVAGFTDATFATISRLG